MSFVIPLVCSDWNHRRTRTSLIWKQSFAWDQLFHFVAIREIKFFTFRGALKVRMRWFIELNLPRFLALCKVFFIVIFHWSHQMSKWTIITSGVNMCTDKAKMDWTWDAFELESRWFFIGICLEIQRIRISCVEENRYSDLSVNGFGWCSFCRCSDYANIILFIDMSSGLINYRAGK